MGRFAGWFIKFSSSAKHCVHIQWLDWQFVHICHTAGSCFSSTGGSRLSRIFLGVWKSVRLKHYPAYPIIIMSLIIQRNLATKIRAKQESSLTAVRLKRDPPVPWFLCVDSVHCALCRQSCTQLSTVGPICQATCFLRILYCQLWNWVRCGLLSFGHVWTSFYPESF